MFCVWIKWKQITFDIFAFYIQSSFTRYASRFIVRTGIIPPASTLTPNFPVPIQINSIYLNSNVAMLHLFFKDFVFDSLPKECMSRKDETKSLKTIIASGRNYSGRRETWFLDTCSSFCNFRTNKRRALSSWYITCSVSTGCVATFQYQVRNISFLGKRKVLQRFFTATRLNKTRN